MKKSLLVILSFSFGLSASAQVPAYVPLNNLEAWWGFNGNANDASTYGRHGSVSGATLTNDRHGSPNAAYSFNGNGDVITVGPTGISDLSKSTLSVWVKYTGDANSSRSYDSYFHFGNFPDNSFGYGYQYSQLKFNFYRKCQLAEDPLFDIRNEWHHVVVVQNDYKSFFYVDAQLIDSAQNTQVNCMTSTTNLFLGAHPSDLQWMTGQLDDVGFWTRALTPCEIEDLYYAGSIFTAQPMDQTVQEGGNTIFTVSAAAAVNYQWQTATNGGTNFVNLANSGQYSGVQTASLSVSGVLLSNNDQLFRCIITTKEHGCNSISEAAQLTVNTSVGIVNPSYIFESRLHQNIPNPVVESTVIPYYIASFKETAYINISDLTGRTIKMIPVRYAGNGSVSLEKQQLGKGMYIYSLFIDGIKVSSRKMIIAD